MFSNRLTRFAWLASVFFTAVSAEAQVTRSVPAEFPTIQAAIAAARSGDTIVVSAGTYRENINFLRKTIVVRSESGPESTIIDGGQKGWVVTFSGGEGPTSALSGFTIRNGKPTSTNPTEGGGITVQDSAAPLIENNRIVDNLGCDGAGIRTHFASPLIRGNLISNNKRDNCGGGVGGGINIGGASKAQIVQNTISNNVCFEGGGISLFAAGETIIRENYITGNIVTGTGGGISMVNGSDALVVQNVIVNNIAPAGGGGIVWSVPSGNRGPLVINNTIAENDSPYGSAISARGFDSNTELRNNLLIAKAGQIAVTCDNEYDRSSPIFKFNTIFAAGAFSLAGPCTAAASDGNSFVDPLLVAPDAGNFRLQAGSPVIDAGAPAPAVPSTDLDGNPRNARQVDMGAYEFAGVTEARLSTTALSFNSQSAEAQPVTVTNAGGGGLNISRIAVSGEFSATDTCRKNTPILSGGSCTINVSFVPAANGTRTGQIQIIGNTGAPLPAITLTGAASGPMVTVSATELSFAPTVYGTQSEEQTFALTNSGDAPLPIIGIRGNSDFLTDNNCGTSLPAGSSCKVTVSFRPSARGWRNGTVTITDKATGSPQVVTVSGKGLAPVLSYLPSQFQLPFQTPGSSASSTLVLRNLGDVPLNVSGVTATGDFSASNDCASVAFGEYCRIQVSFSPTVTGSRTGQLLIADNAPGSPHLVMLTGASGSPNISVSTTSVAFANTLIGNTSPQSVVLISNSGAVAQLSSVTATGDFSAVQNCTTLMGNSPCLIGVRFTPSALGLRTGMLNIAVTGSDRIYSVSLSGIGVAVGLSAPTSSFPTTPIGETTTLQASFINGSSNPVNITSITVTGQFSQTNDCGARVDPGSACTVSVSFKPLAVGTFSSSLTVTSDAPLSASQVSFTGRAGSASLSPVPASVDFGPQLVGESSEEQTVTLANSGSAQVGFFEVTLEGDFVQRNSCRVPFSSCSFFVTFSPTQTGTRTGAIIIKDDAPGSPHRIPLSGTGVTVLPPPAIKSISPNAAEKGGPEITVTISGERFVPGTVLRWNGAERPATFISPKLITANIPPTDLATFGAPEVTVFAPLPGGGLSNAVGFTVYSTISLQSKDLVSSPTTGSVYASVAHGAPRLADSVARINPATARVDASIPIGNDPGKLATSDNGQYLYVGLDALPALKRVDTGTGLTDLFCELDGPAGPYVATDLEVLPQNPRAVAVVRKIWRGGYGGVAIYDDGAKRQLEVPPIVFGNPVNIITPADTADVLYGFNNSNSDHALTTLGITGAGLTTLNETRNLLSQTQEIKFDNGRIYSTEGAVIDPINRTVIATFGVPSSPVSVLPDSRLGLTFFLSLQQEQTAIVSAFDQRSLQLVGSITFATSQTVRSTDLGSLIRWGDKGLAFRMFDAQVVFLEIPKAWIPPSADVFTLANLGASSRVSTNASSPLAVGYARIRPASGNTTPAGVAIFAYRPGNYLVSETGVPATPPLMSGRLYAETDGPVNTGIAIANPNAQTATIRFSYTDTQGNQLGSGTTTIPPNGQIAKFIDAPPLNTFGSTAFRGTLSFDSDVPVAAMAIRSLYNERGDFLMSTLPVIDTAAPAANATVMIPHFADGDGWTTRVLLVNPTEAPQSGRITFRNDAGSPVNVTIDGENASTFSYLIPPRSSKTLATDGTAPAGTAGSIRVEATAGTTAPVSQVVFAYKRSGVTVSLAGVPTMEGSTFRSYVESIGVNGQSGNIQSGIAIANNSSEPVKVTLDLMRLDGTSTVFTTSIDLPAFGHIAKFMPQFFSNFTVPTPFQGVVRISAKSAAISLVGLRSHINEKADFLITTLPPSNEDVPAGTSELFFPQLAAGGSYTTQFILFSGSTRQTTSGQMLFVDQNGNQWLLPLQ